MAMRSTLVGVQLTTISTCIDKCGNWNALMTTERMDMDKKIALLHLASHQHFFLFQNHLSHLFEI